MAHTTDYHAQMQERNREIMNRRYQYDCGSMSAQDRFFERQAERVPQEADRPG